MKKKIIILVTSFSLFVILVFSQGLKTKKNYDTKDLIGKPISEVTLSLLNDKGSFNINELKKNNFSLINFWASWCAPCKKEMPSLDKLQSNFNEIKIFPINIKESDKKKSEIFFKNLNINNLQIYFDIDSKLANIFWLRGIPTTIILNKNKQEIARIVGDADFEDEKFIKWLKENKK